ncbi:MAG: hypothetical protein ACRC0A_07215 [Chitinophagaceae bacterium]
MHKTVFPRYLFSIVLGIFLGYSCTTKNPLSVRDTAFFFSKALFQGNNKIVKLLLLPNEDNKKLYTQWEKWYRVLDHNTKQQLFLRTQSIFEIVNTDILKVDSLVIVQVKFDIPNTPNNVLKMVYYNKQWLVDWAYSESGNF